MSVIYVYIPTYIFLWSMHKLSFNITSNSSIELLGSLIGRIYSTDRLNLHVGDLFPRWRLSQCKESVIHISKLSTTSVTNIDISVIIHCCRFLDEYFLLPGKPRAWWKVLSFSMQDMIEQSSFGSSCCYFLRSA